MIRRSAEPVYVAILASSPALRAGLESMLAQSSMVASLGKDDLAAGLVPDVVLLESRSHDQLIDLIEDWPIAGVLFVGDPPSDALQSNLDRTTGAVSSEVDPAQLVVAITAVALGLNIFDPLLSERARFGFYGRDGAKQEANPLTPRERQVLELVANGYPNKSIAYELGISEHTAKFHVGSLLTKLDAASRAEVVTNATRRGLLTV